MFPGGISNNTVVKRGGKLWLAGGKSYGATVEDGDLWKYGNIVEIPVILPILNFYPAAG